MWDQILSAMEYRVRTFLMSINLRSSLPQLETTRSLVWKSLTLIALSCNPKTLSHWAADCEAQWVLSRLVNRASLCWVLSAARQSLLRWFLHLSLSLLLSSDSICELYVASFSYIFRHVYITCGNTASHTNRAECIYRLRTYHINKYTNRQFFVLPTSVGLTQARPNNTRFLVWLCLGALSSNCYSLKHMHKCLTYIVLSQASTHTHVNAHPPNWQFCGFKGSPCNCPLC